MLRNRVVWMSLLSGVLTLTPVWMSASAETVCPDRETFAQSGWEQKTVQDAMDDYLRDHRMRAHWGQEPVPPDAVGRDYYEWLWVSGFGARMKTELTGRFCGTAPAETAPLE